MQDLYTAAVGSLTHAMKGQRILSEIGVSTTIVKLDSKKTRRGCAYGIEFPSSRLREVRAALSASRLPVTQYVDGGGEPV